MSAKRDATRSGLSFVVRAGVGMGALYGLYYYPYSAGSWPGRALAALLALQARAAGWMIGCFEADVRVEAANIHGRFPMQVVKACSSLDAQALFLATLLAFPCPWREKLSGAVLGVLLLSLLNVTRIASLYFVGLYRPSWFDMVHEEVFPLLLVVAACAMFASWAFWTRRNPLTASHG